MKQKIFYSLPEYTPLTKEIVNLGGWTMGNLNRKQFPDGERYLQIQDNIVDQEVVIVGGTFNEVATMELYDLACAVAKYGAYKLTLIIPYYGYSTMERAIKLGEVVPAKTRARLLSAIPQTPGGNEILLLDLHSEGISYYFEGNTKVFHLYAKEIWKNLFPKLGGTDFILGSTDAGRAKWVESLAQDMNVSPAFIYKKRLSGSQTKVTAVNAQVKDKVVIIYDDMIRTGGSLIGAAQAYKDAGAKEIFAVTTHGIFPDDAEDKLIKSGLFKQIHSTNSYPKDTKMVVRHSVASIFVNFLNSRKF